MEGIVGMKIKKGVFISGFIGVAMIFALTFNFMGCGKKSAREHDARGKSETGKAESSTVDYKESKNLEARAVLKNEQSGNSKPNRFECPPGGCPKGYGVRLWDGFGYDENGRRVPAGGCECVKEENKPDAVQAGGVG